MSTTIWIILAFVLIASWLLLVRRQRQAWRPPYISARARIEGGGIKRGLTPPEGAILLGRPLHAALTLVIFDLLRKGFVRQIGHAPFVVEVADAMRTHGDQLSTQARTEKRLRAAQAMHKPMHKYEEAFLEILEANPDAPIHAIDYSIAIQPLVRYVAGRVGGFDLEDTRQYYELIIERAPREARSDGVLTQDRQKVFDRNFGWVLLGQDYAAVLETDDYSYLPVWLRTVDLPLGGQNFAAWATDVFAQMAAALQSQQLELDALQETDLTTRTLLQDISEATFYG